jgi:small conductance mechanosensitive channel
MDFSRITSTVYELLALYGIRVIAALAILVIGRWIAAGIRRFIQALMTRSKVDHTLVAFVGNLTYFAVLAFVVLAALNQLGIQTASFIAVIGAAGLAVGLALQGSLANFAAGVLLILFRPFKVGDVIEGAGVTGVVEEISIFTTQLKTADNKTVIVPNAKISGDNIVNWTAKGTRRVDMMFGIGYGDDIDRARAIISGVLDEDSRVLKDPPYLVAVSELGDSSVNLAVRPWARCEDYWGVYFDTVEKVKKRFDKEGVSIPFPQRDIHVYSHGSAENIA